jgi:hypothetical protein
MRPCCRTWLVRSLTRSRIACSSFDVGGAEGLPDPVGSGIGRPVAGRTEEISEYFARPTRENVNADLRFENLTRMNGGDSAGDTECHRIRSFPPMKQLLRSCPPPATRDRISAPHPYRSPGAVTGSSLIRAGWSRKHATSPDTGRYPRLAQLLEWPNGSRLSQRRPTDLQSRCAGHFIARCVHLPPGYIDSIDVEELEFREWFAVERLED